MGERGIIFEAGGRSYRLFLGTLAMLRYEASAKAAGEPESVLEAAQKLQGGDLSMARLLRLFECGLTPAPGSEEALAEIVDALGLTEAMSMLGDALSSSLSGLQETPAEKKPARGSRSPR